MMKKLPLAYALLVLNAGNTPAEPRVELSVIPRQFLGTWGGLYTDPPLMIRIGRRSVRLRWEDGTSTACQVQNVVAYDDGLLFGLIFPKRKHAVVCDRASTDREQANWASVGLHAPEDYRTTFYFTLTNEHDVIRVSITEYISQGWPGSEGTVTRKLDDFFRE